MAGLGKFGGTQRGKGGDGPVDRGGRRSVEQFRPVNMWVGMMAQDWQTECKWCLASGNSTASCCHSWCFIERGQNELQVVGGKGSSA